jgi:hypothetical protein
MDSELKYKIGILAFGSIIDNPGEEIIDFQLDRINCETPFKVEFARISSSRSNAPTLMPVNDNSKGRKVKAVIFVLNSDKIILEQAKSVLWRRECHKIDKSETYKERKTPSSKNVLIKEWDNFLNVDKVIYTSFILQEEYKDLTPNKLADFAIQSILSKAGGEKKDGIRYLLSAKNNGIQTELSDEYEKFILDKTETKSLSEAIEKLDRIRILSD